MLASAGVQRSLTEKEKDERFVFFTVTYLLKYFAAICGINQHLVEHSRGLLPTTHFLVCRLQRSFVDFIVIW